MNTSRKSRVAPQPYRTVIYDRRGWVLKEDADRVRAERDAAYAALRDVRDERTNGATANPDYIEKRIAEGLGEARA